MPNEIKQFRTAAKSGQLTPFMIDDETFHIAPVTLQVAELVAQLQGRLAAGDSLMPDNPSADDLVGVLLPFIAADDAARFSDYAKSYVTPSEFGDVIRYVIAEVTGRNPTSPASSPDGSSTTGAASRAGASGTGSAGRSSSLSQKASTPTSSRSASGRTKSAAKKSTGSSSRRTSSTR